MVKNISIRFKRLQILFSERDWQELIVYFFAFDAISE